MIGAFLTTVLWSFSAIFARKSTRVFGPSFANFSRLFLACILLGIYSHLFAPPLEWNSFQVLFWSGLVGLGLGDLALFVALPRLGSRLSLLMVQCLAAPIAALIEWIWLGTSLLPMQIVSGAVVLVGIAIAFRPSGEVKPDALGIGMGLLAAIGQGAGAIISRRAYDYMEIANIAVDGGSAAYQRMLGGFVISGLYFALESAYKRRKSAAGNLSPNHAQEQRERHETSDEARLPFIDDSSPSRSESQSDSNPEQTGKKAGPRDYLYILGNTLCGPVIGVACYQWALSEQPGGVVLPIVAATPLVAIPFTRWLEQDSAGLQAWGGGLIAALGVAGLVWSTPATGL
ncbi:MAG: hypothetical protein CMN76_20590 [Spirochaetaceae bacterium]|nr:hypothetical protein [Spirochaetaceae bacterium]|tara:strand:+ start:13335 stop:14366 length:1032 start_codon:yes stop_codon:yes gene_type:complete